MDENRRKIGIFTSKFSFCEDDFLQQFYSTPSRFTIKILAGSPEIKNRRKIGVEDGFYLIFVLH